MRKILIAEDDFFIRDIYNQLFSTGGYHVDVAIDGEDALQKIKGNPNPYDMILLDIMMPKVSGLDVLKQIRTMTAPVKDTAVFILTNLGQQNIIEEAFKIGMDGYIIKSQMTPPQILAEINTFLTNKIASPQQ
ncbi:MAG TPA: response regulator [Patescibacteria group bacterium]